MKKPRSRRQLSPDARLKNARKWLAERPTEDLLNQYRRCYHVTEMVAYVELVQLGYEDTLRIQAYERDGIAWGYMVDGYSGDMKVVPKGMPEWELHLY